MMNCPVSLCYPDLSSKQEVLAFPKRFQENLLGVKLPSFTLDWLEILLQGFALSGLLVPIYQKRRKATPP